MPKVLIVEDDLSLVRNLKAGLERKGYQVEFEDDGERGEYLAKINRYDAIVLDIQLPHKDGLEICSALRHAKIRTPIIMLTQFCEVEERIKGLNCGADDYLPKPFSFDELEARLQSIIRRSKGHPNPVLEYGPLRLDLVRREFFLHGERIKLSKKELGIMEILMNNHGGVVTRQELIEMVWGERGEELGSNCLEVYISRLRRTLRDKNLIKSFTNVGYMLEADDAQ